jgi:hypothetical protein
MSACEACWKEASAVALSTGQSTADVYHELVNKRLTCPHDKPLPTEGLAPQRLTDESAGPLILTDAEAQDCGGVASQLRDLARVILSAKAIPAKDRASFLDEAADLLEKVYIAHYPPKL